MEYAIDKLEDLGLRNLAKLVLEKEEQIDDLQDELVKLQQRIDKAIELLKDEDFVTGGTYSYETDWNNIDKIINILKGGEK